MITAMLLLCLITLDAMMWRAITGLGQGSVHSRIYFLGVTQGESALLVLPDGRTIMIDAGPPDGSAVAAIQKILPPGDTRIDLAIISYPQEGDWGGYIPILAHYSVGAFVYNGRNDIANPDDWHGLLAKISAEHIPLITVGEGDHIIMDSVADRGAHVFKMDILAPDTTFVRSAEPRDTAIVARVAMAGFTALFPADIGGNAAIHLGAGGINLHADVLKAPFPLLNISSTTMPDSSAVAFLRAVAPRAIVITPGTKGISSAPLKLSALLPASSTAARVFILSSTGTVGFASDSGRSLLYNEE